jgi:two-component system chemotaxis response regulator CheB
MNTGEPKNVIVIGASAGGIAAVSALLQTLSVSLNAAIFIVIHVPSVSKTEIILRQLQRNSQLACKVPKDLEAIEINTVYLAPADHHMMLDGDQILVRRGAFENHWRPSIDVLFRSAAASFGSCVTGIVLTGMLDDGTSGMIAIKKAGGRTIIQDPAQAEFIEMPTNVLQNIEVDDSANIEEMSYILNDYYATHVCDVGHIPKDVSHEAAITLRMSSEAKELEPLSSLSNLTCPDCGGTLYKINGEKGRYRCYTGHSFSEISLENEQLVNLESSIWVAIRMMEERKNLLNSMETYRRASNTERAFEMEVHIKRLKEVLLSLNDSMRDDET